MEYCFAVIRSWRIIPLGKSKSFAISPRAYAHSLYKKRDCRLFGSAKPLAVTCRLRATGFRPPDSDHTPQLLMMTPKVVACSILGQNRYLPRKEVLLFSQITALIRNKLKLETAIICKIKLLTYIVILPHNSKKCKYIFSLFFIFRH